MFLPSLFCENKILEGVYCLIGLLEKLEADNALFLWDIIPFFDLIDSFLGVPGFDEYSREMRLFFTHALHL
jgi:hypothetical protein